MSRQHLVGSRALALLAVVAAGALGALPVAVRASGSWASITPFDAPPREDHAAATGPDGRVYLIGGTGDVGVWPGVEAYTPSTNHWAGVAPLNTARSQLAATTSPAAGDANGLIYALGGNDSNSNSLNVVEQYTPSSNTWTNVSPMPTPRKMLAAATGQDGRVYAIGGCCNPPNIGETDIVEVYTPGTNHWATATHLNHGRFGLGATTGLDGRIYVFGGCCPNGNPTNTAEVYDPSTNTWTDIAPMSTVRQSLAAATGADGRIYAIGGADGQGNLLSSVEAYDPSSNQWSPAPTMNTARSRLAAAASPPPGSAPLVRLYALGGFVGSSQGGITTSSEELDTSSSAVVPEATSTVMILGAALVAIGLFEFGVRRRSRRRLPRTSA